MIGRAFSKTSGVSFWGVCGVLPSGILAFWNSEKLRCACKRMLGHMERGRSSCKLYHLMLCYTISHYVAFQYITLCHTKCHVVSVVASYTMLGCYKVHSSPLYFILFVSAVLHYTV